MLGWSPCVCGCFVCPCFWGACGVGFVGPSARPRFRLYQCWVAIGVGFPHRDWFLTVFGGDAPRRSRRRAGCLPRSSVWFFSRSARAVVSYRVIASLFCNDCRPQHSKTVDFPCSNYRILIALCVYITGPAGRFLWTQVARAPNHAASL